MQTALPKQLFSILKSFEWTRKVSLPRSSSAKVLEQGWLTTYNFKASSGIPRSSVLQTERRGESYRRTKPNCWLSGN